jgi:signal transduction histidine kinase
LRELNETLEGRVAERTGQLSRANEVRDLLRLQLVQAEEQERARLARELHDEVGQHLTALGLGLQALSDVAPPGSEVDRRAGQLRELVASLSQEMHALAIRLRPKALDDFGLKAAIDAYVDAWSQRSGITIDLHATSIERLSPNVESAIYRVVQEALTNVARHSRATRASVVVERRDGQVVAIIEDDGRGFDARSGGDLREHGGLGLLGIHERASLLGGSAQVESTVGTGTTVIVRIPLSAPAGSHHDDGNGRGSEAGDA